MNSTSIDKALKLLEHLAATSDPSSLQELAEAVRLPKSSVHRFLNYLQELGYVSRPAEGRKYQIGPRAARLAATDSYAIVKTLVRPLLRQIHEEFNETVNLGVLSGQQILYLDFIETTHLLRYIINPGYTNPWNCTAMGQAIAAKLDNSRLEKLLNGTKFQLMTRMTIMSFETLNTRLARIRRTGVAEEEQESVTGVCCLAISLAELGHPEASISLALPKERLTPKIRTSIHRFLKALVQ